MAMYAQTSGTQSTTSGSFVAIPGLSITLPEGVDTTAIVILNLPNPYAQGNNFPGGMLGISVNGTVSPVQASFTYNEQNPVSRAHSDHARGRRALGPESQTVQGVWFGVRGS